MAGDIVVLATDGLFDNMHLEDITSVVNEWEKKWFRGKSHDLTKPINSKQEAQSIMRDLARTLVERYAETGTCSRVVVVVLTPFPLPTPVIFGYSERGRPR
jgi:hypothetical protein